MAYFSNSNRGEIPELQAELNSLKQDQKREAVKKVIAAMTVGKDVSALFPHVVKCMEINNIELKKLVYLYIINYAKTQPDLAIMAVNSFRKDARNPQSPLIRALAVRTMGCIRVEKITEYLCEPLKDALQDQDPYVRKTAAICVSKLFDIAPELVEDTDFLNLLQTGLNDGNALVLSNTVAALTEISEMRGSPVVTLNPQTINRILAALNESTEWGQVFILDFIATYVPTDSKEAESILERVVPRLAHANPAVVMSAVKVIMKYLDMISSPDSIRSLCKKLAPSLVTLVNSEPEIQYVALRCINLIVQKRPNILDKEVRVFFCKFNDPNYVKMEKLEIMIRLADSKNIEQVLHEFCDYATEIDVDFVRKAIQAIGRCAIKLERSVDKCVQALLDLIKLKVSYAVQEIIIVVRDIFRKYPNRFEMIIRDIFQSIDSLDNPDAKSALIWIIGEYADKIDDAGTQLRSLSESFVDEPLQVQLQILTATVKFFLKKPDEGEAMITSLLKTATEECPNPDLRDRAYIYWRLLSSDPEATKQVVLCEKPLISDASYVFESTFLDKLIEQMGTLASIYHKPYENKASKVKAVEQEEAGKEDIETDNPTPTAQPPYSVENLLEFDIGSVQPVIVPNKAKVPLQVVLTKETQGSNQQQYGLQVEMAFQRDNGIVLECNITNYTQLALTDFAMQFNINHFGLTLQDPLSIDSLLPNNSTTAKLRVATNGQSSQDSPGVPFIVQMAIRCTLDVFYFQTPCMFTTLLTENGRLSKEAFKEQWKSIPESNEFLHSLQNIFPQYNTPDLIKSRLEANNVFHVATRKAKDTNEEVFYFSSEITDGRVILSELRIPSVASQIQISCKVPSTALAPLFIQAINFLLSTNS
mmetsp:Transcript_23909/g.23665  ORF Transcript_23909/g.23665 Transcript_23909/m.23665 type:complete len:873 (-) Transcript_23909:35-2653(-)